MGGNGVQEGGPRSLATWGAGGGTQQFRDPAVGGHGVHGGDSELGASGCRLRQGLRTRHTIEPGRRAAERGLAALGQGWRNNLSLLGIWEEVRATTGGGRLGRA